MELPLVHLQEALVLVLVLMLVVQVLQKVVVGVGGANCVEVGMHTV